MPYMVLRSFEDHGKFYEPGSPTGVVLDHEPVANSYAVKSLKWIERCSPQEVEEYMAKFDVKVGTEPEQQARTDKAASEQPVRTGQAAVSSPPSAPPAPPTSPSPAPPPSPPAPPRPSSPPRPGGRTATVTETTTKKDTEEESNGD